MVSNRLNGMRRWPYTIPLVFAAIVAIITVSTAQSLGLPIRDPDGFMGPSYVRLPVIVLMFFAAGIIPETIASYGWKPLHHNIVRVIRHDWSWIRVANIATGLLTFYVCYVSYRNMKSYLPVIRNNVLYDTDLLRMDHFLFLGHYPGDILHSILGTTVSAQILAFFYVSYLMLIPILLGGFLVLSKDYLSGAVFAAALAINWVLGAVSYYLVPTLGPAFAQPQSFDDLPTSAASALQRGLFRNRVDFLTDPWESGKIHGIAGFASLHVSVVVTGVVFLWRFTRRVWVHIATIAFLVITITATLYFGWHYIADDVAGAFIGWFAVVLACWMTGSPQHLSRRKRPPADAVDPSAAVNSNHQHMPDAGDGDDGVA